jgi:hypothetical protein
LTAIAAEAAGQLMVPVAQAAIVLGVSEDTLYRAGETGEVPVKRIRSCRLVPVAWLRTFTAWPPEPQDATT